MDNMIAYLRELNAPSMMLRIVLAIINGGIIGFEREKKNRPASHRTATICSNSVFSGFPRMDQPFS